jgi:uncharacterized protein
MNEFLNQREVKRSIVAVLILLAVFLLVKSINELKVNGTIGKTEFSNTISVVGVGKVLVIPDIATFSFSVSEESETVKIAQDSVSERVSNILDSLDKLDIKEKDIKTLNYNVYPQYEFYRKQIICPAGSYCPPTSERTLTGYEVSQTISIKLRDLDRAGKILNSLGELGVSNLNGPNFDVEDRDELVRNARKMAIEDAKKKAKELSKDLGVKLDKIVSFQEGRNFGMPYKMEASFDSAVGIDGSFEPEIPVGENEISSNVEIIYEIK